MIFSPTDMVRPELDEHGAGRGYCVGLSGVIRRFGRWDCEGPSMHRHTTPHHIHMIFGLTNTVGPELDEHGAGLGYCVGPSGVIRRFNQWNCEGLSMEAEKCG